MPILSSLFPGPHFKPPTVPLDPISREPLPRPIPIITFPSRAYPFIREYSIVMRVIDHGHPEVASRLHHTTRGGGFSPDDEQFWFIYDRARRELLRTVGIRHGIWICHVLGAEQYNYFSNTTPLPPVSKRIYELAKYKYLGPPLYSVGYDINDDGQPLVSKEELRRRASAEFNYPPHHSF